MESFQRDTPPPAAGPEAELIAISRRLCREVNKLRFGGNVALVYNPLDYAREPHEAYLQRYGRTEGVALLLGMNPGPFGMAQTGVPFGEVSLVRDWLKIGGHVGRPREEHPKRPVVGFSCHRTEVSGARLWGWARKRFGAPEKFFARFFVWNYCPLAFLLPTGANYTPDKLASEERERLYQVCNRALQGVVQALQPKAVVGIGQFAEDRAREALAGSPTPVGCILHPSPANPKANGGWEEIAEQQLRELDLLPLRNGGRGGASPRVNGE